MNKVKIALIYGITLLLSFILYLSFSPNQYSDIRQHIFLFSLVSIFPIGIATFLVKYKKRAFLVSSVFFVLGLFFLYRGFFFNQPFSVIDYFFVDNVETIIEKIDETQVRIIHTTPFTYRYLEGIIIYCILNTLGITIGYYNQKTKKL